jgi:hypothetical protein
MDSSSPSVWGMYKAADGEIFDRALRGTFLWYPMRRFCCRATLPKLSHWARD